MSTKKLFILQNNKNEVTDYIIQEYTKKFEKIITPIKLQKTLYFLFSSWFTIRDKILIDYEELDELIYDEVELDKEKFNDILNILGQKPLLFEISFSAWKYGPVDLKSYDYRRNLEFNSIHIFEDSKKLQFNSSLNENSKIQIQNWFDISMNRIFITDDFALVDLSHEDRAWINAFNKEPGAIMSIDEIENEYISKNIMN